MMDFVIPNYVQIVCDCYRRSNYDIYIVGGAARDIIMNRTPYDYDLTTNATPNEGIKLLNDAGIKVIDTSKRHGTIIAIVDRKQIEITTYRVDGTYQDNRHPDQVTFTSNVNEDAARRDFTMNSLYIQGDTIVDLFGGKADISERIIRAVGDPYVRFDEDALRMLRALRFKSTLGFEIEETTDKAIRQLFPRLKEISRERVSDELVKLLVGKNASSVIRDYPDILDMFIPGIKDMEGFDQRSRYHDKTLLEHTLSVLDLLEKRTPELCLAALLHDIGKPLVFVIDDEGYGHMKQHSLESARIADEFLSEYRFSNSFRNEIKELIYMHDVFPETKSELRKYLSKYDASFWHKLDILQRADILSHSPYGHKRLELLESRSRMMNEIIEDDECYSLDKLAINGEELIALGCKPGPQIGLILNELLDMVINENIENSYEILSTYVIEKYGEEISDKQRNGRD